MKEIARYQTTRDWFRLQERSHDVMILPETRTVINYEGSLYEELTAIPAVNRLDRVKQLGLACNTSNSMPARQTRYGHSLVFATQIDYIAQRLGLDRVLAVTVAMLHDIASPPLSDSVAKALGINDEELFAKVLESSPEALEYLREHGIEKQRVVNLVRGRDYSPLGQLVNSQNSIDVDRWSYVTLDASKLGHLPQTWTGSYIADPFESASIVNGRVVFGDPGVVGEFLEARTQMFEKVYKNESLMAKEAFVGRVAKELYKRRLLNMKTLFQIGDSEFEWLAYRTGELGIRLFQMLDGFKSYGTVKAEPKQVIRELRKMTKRPFEVKKHKPVNPAIETPILEGKRVVPYKELEPLHSRELARRMRAWDRTFVYGPENDAELEKAVGEVQAAHGGNEEVMLA